MENLVIREARKEDCSRILELIKELALYEKAPEQVTVTLAEMEECGFGDKPVWGSLVAEIDNEIVGIALHYDRYSTWKGRRLYLEDLIVTEKMRGTGIGKLLLDELIVYAKENKYNGMVWQVLDWNEPAINFYKKYKADFDSEWINVSVNF
ncbi:L-amino acid N-acyltransferase YncA [Chishuiella changwenlii]|jgi:GNAT superfamily N-acetyltransferase|uniref:L-amino acid N-acyltransferase YncA n=1 Tax=Chishuiella changwenlii TaxID=1434701 RepID=A0A1M7BS08_9FLAO|nr:GNAT family N-acetyltransferase [Chishuiella changwenlii]GGF03465.1 N-acetyltransferase [Chishuiella changwenlii]SHL57734.1 L-amino acid N-acyltransferase YncA [Chishuiella changwenlii]